MFAVNGVIVIAAATYLPYLADVIARQSGLGETFVGNTVVAMATSLPEVVVSIAALRVGAVDLAFGNLFGSNLFNILIVALNDVFFTAGPILRSAEAIQLLPAVAGMLMSAIVIIGLTYQTLEKKLVLAWDSIAILVVYGMTVLLLYVGR